MSEPVEPTTTAQPFAAWSDKLPRAYEDLSASITYIPTVGGVVVFRKVPYGVVSEMLQGEPLVPSPYPLLSPLPPLKAWLNTPKIPWGVYAQVVAFFRKVYERDKAEAIIRVFYDETTKTWVPHCPPQEVSGAHVDHKDDFDANGKLRHVADIHSHNTMAAFFSGTDDADEKKAVRLYGVVGLINQTIPASSWRAWTGKKFEDLSLSDVVELPTEEEMNVTVRVPIRKMAGEKAGVKEFTINGESVGTALFPADFPEEWMAKVKVKT